ncbi:helix-turn-helix transcriptional regulator [Halopenitus persicus]|uniref:MarR family protein n=1 Tax=Halopenitus persicus TaxID=1048396 RepID=A0A1H3J6E3_9EURY|nr:MarR family transcriptional regulator [Halopenitus persicus]SDY35472.1 MarR family protein [Halopenitus persicus]
MSVSELEADLSADERAGLELIRETGGIHQSDFWKELDVSSRKGSRIAEALEEAELIERERTVYDGHNTYFLEPTARDLDFSLLMAGDMLSPFIGEEEIDPQSDAFSQWLMNLAYEEY